MTAIRKYFSPTTGSGSLLFSVLAHLLVFGAMAGFFKLGFGSHKPVETYVDLGYQTFDAPPPPAPVVHKVRRSAEPTAPVDKNVKPDDTPKELQDAKSDISGTQVAKKETNLGTESTGTFADTPYYKIKPKYPPAAAVAGITGHVDFEIDINEKGEVENIRVVGGEHLETFQREARRALEQWKYKPFTDPSGKAIRKEHHFVTVNFTLKDLDANS